MNLFAVAEGPHVSIVADRLFTVAGIPVTNSMMLGVIAYTLLLVAALLLARGVKKGSTSKPVVAGQWAFEILLNMTEEIVGNHKLARSIAPLAISIFFAVMFNNWMGILPGVGAIEYDGAPLFRGLAADLNFTFGLAIVTMVSVQIYAIKQFGFFGNAGRYLISPFKDPVGAFEGILEFVGEFSRFVALSMRLFGNVFGGEVLLSVIAFLSGWLGFLPLPLFMGFELFVGALQAFVFYILTVIFISLAVSHGPSDSHESHSKEQPVNA